MSDGFYYLATPYSNYPLGAEAAYRDACLAAAECFREGLLVFSPIAHTHSIALLGGMAGGYDTWCRYDEAMMTSAIGLIVVRMPGWEASKGVTAEISWFRESGKPILFREPPMPFFAKPGPPGR